MKIADADIRMNASRTYAERDEKKETLRIWTGRQNTGPAADRISISQKAHAVLEQTDIESDAADTDAGMCQEITLKKLIAEVLSGRKIHPLHVEKDHGRSCEMKEDKAGHGDSGRQGWGLEYNCEQTHIEKEDVSFNARGVISTADGKEISFSLDLSMSREFIERNSLTITAGDAAIDPLVINFDGNAAELSCMKFSFDLDSDGEEEDLPMLSQGSGFLAIDLNSDGIINNGRELFGPDSGDGFAELAVYDTDGNSWIDENDDVFQRLRIMRVDETGTMRVETLRDSGVGAIGLAKKSTQFDLRLPADNELLGQVQSTGIYVAEEGSVGTIQQLNFVV